jgi:hypothetical protein
MLAALGARQVAAWMAFYQVEAEDELQAQAVAQAQAAAGQGGSRALRR